MSIRVQTVSFPVEIRDENDHIDSYDLSLTDQSSGNSRDSGKIEWGTDKKRDSYRIRIQLTGLAGSDTFRASKVLDLDPRITTEKDGIVNRFNAAFEQQYDLLEQNERDGVEDFADDDDQSQPQPYDPSEIRVDAKFFSVFDINRMIDQRDIDLSPDFQRNFVWDAKRQSRLIESLLLRIPLPVFYFSQDSDGTFHVVDGLQRLTVISMYLNNKFRLKNLEYLNDFEGKWFNSATNEGISLPRPYARRIEQTQLVCYVIDPSSPDSVKYDIFTRLNTGGKALNAQEIRNCLASKSARQFLKNLAQGDEFLEATHHSISGVRMADQELVLRFVTFYILDHNMHFKHEKNNYNSGKSGTPKMGEQLNRASTLLNFATDEEYLRIGEAFRRSMSNSVSIFGSTAFQRDRNQKIVNKALFLAISRLLCDYSIDQIDNEFSKNQVRSLLSQKLQENDTNNSLYRSISWATNNPSSIETAYNAIKAILEESYSD